MIPPETLQPVPKFKAGDTAWIMADNKPASITLVRAKVVFVSAQDKPDEWSRTESYLELKWNYNQTELQSVWHAHDQIFPTKQELLQSL